MSAYCPPSDFSMVFNEGNFNGTCGVNVRGISMTSNITGQLTPVLADRNGFQMVHLTTPLDIYDQVTTYERKSIIQQSFEYGINTDLVTETILDFGLISTLNGIVSLNSNAMDTGRAVITSKDFIKSQSDEGLVIYITAAFGPPVANNVQEIGLISSSDGVAFTQTSSGLRVITRVDEIDAGTLQADWNIDTLDGTGPSGMLLDPTKLNTYRIELVNTCCIIYSVKHDKTAEWNPVHKTTVSNTLTFMPLRLNANFICVLSENTGPSVGATLRVAAFSCFNSGEFKVRGPLRSFSAVKDISAIEPILSLQNKTIFNGLPNKITSFLKILSSSSFGNRPITVTLVLNSVLTGPVWVDFDTDNSPIQYDDSATISTGGRAILTIVLTNSDSKFINLEDLDIKINPGDIISVLAESANTNEVTVAVTFKSDL